ncbi:NAD(P)-binding protein [Mollisia scopiformis]|uniref:NAD(P)-binding protein n=1 Tax=Mollisia scopiformis TaxID=149040 RepID=A0A194WTM7_MOLSC|nr:NAD(P)-binding protein [Mollisia scopiformis]KUJ11311.1 NAD(P)-binding protein [Mollisia scopiformis]
MAPNKKVFIVGPGFIGWNIIDLLVPEGYSIAGLVRRKKHADGISASGATPVMGDLNDKALISSQAQEADIIFHTATADHLPSVEAILDGISARAKQGKETIFIHTSGTSVLDDNALGAFKSTKIYHDDIPSELDSVADDAPHRQIDLAIVKTKSSELLKSKAKISIMIPPLIYGFNPKHQRLSIQIPTLTRWAIKHGYAAHVGKGLAVESNIHVLDLARAYVVLLHAMENAGYQDGLLANPYFFCETTGDGEPSWKEVAEVIGEALKKNGKIEDAVPKEMPEELYGDLFGEYTGAVTGLNSRSRANRLRALGWKPVEKDWRRSYLEDELPVILKEDHSGFGGYSGTVAS